MRTYDELSQIESFLDRFEYLKLGGAVGRETFGYDRYLNQMFYRSPEWKKIRNLVILRDNGCDLGVDGYEIQGRVYIHHLNPVSQNDILNRSEILLDPNYLICTTHETHNAIHYGDSDLLMTEPVIRLPNDTCPWRKT